MKSLKTLSFTTLAALATAVPANAYFYAGMAVNKVYRQYSASAPTFTGGNAFMFAYDGTFVMTASCQRNGTPINFPIDTMMGCNIGANGVVVAFGTLGSSTPLYYEVTGVEAASTIEPGRFDLVKLNARPTTEYPSNPGTVQGVQDSLFYNLDSITGDVREYKIAGAQEFGIPGYFINRPYTSRKTMEKEIIEGVYQFKFPKRNVPTQSLYLNFPVVNTVEGYTKEPAKQGFRFIGVPKYNLSFAQFDANIVNSFKWEGLTATHITGQDRQYVSFRTISGGDPAEPSGGITFPPGVRARILSPVNAEYSLPPGFFLPGDYAVLTVDIERDPMTSVGAINYRKFELPIQFVNGFAGSMASSFPEGTSSTTLAKDADPDGDGIPNWVEWLSNTDPAKANAPKTLSAMSFVPPSLAKDGEPSQGYWQMSLDRPTHLVDDAKLVIESSTNLSSWSEITTSDSQWTVIDDPAEPQIRVISKTPGLTEKRYFRVRFNYTGS